jgi:hypothetical protein
MTLGAVRRPVLASVAALALLFGADALLFRTPLYPSYLEPDSSTGLFELILAKERRAQERLGDNVVVTLGDSRLAYYPRVANELTSETGYVFRNAGVAGSDPRLWYYMLRDLDPTARRYRAIVLAVSDYDDEDVPWDFTDGIRDLHYAVARLRLSDAFDFASSFPRPALQWEAFRGALLKGTVYQADMEAFLAHPLKRIDYVHLCRQGYEGWTYGFQESPRSLEGLRIDWSRWSFTAPPSVDAGQRLSVELSLMYRPAPQTGVFAAFRRQWFGRILERYRGSPTRIVFVRLPRGPIPRPQNLVRKRSASVRELAGRPGVVLADEHAFDVLERPELFKDAQHLNHEGCSRLSAMLAREVSRLLAGVVEKRPGGSL